MMTTKHNSRTLNTILWVTQILLALLLLSGAWMKFMPVAEISKMMPWTGQVPETVVRLLGVIDLLGAVGLIIPAALRIKPQLTAWAAIGVFLLMLSAAIFHISRGEAPVIGLNIVVGVAALFIAWGRLRK